MIIKENSMIKGFITIFIHLFIIAVLCITFLLTYSFLYTLIHFMFLYHFSPCYFAEERWADYFFLFPLFIWYFTILESLDKTDLSVLFLVGLKEAFWVDDIGLLLSVKQYIYVFFNGVISIAKTFSFLQSMNQTVEKITSLIKDHITQKHTYISLTHNTNRIEIFPPLK